MKALSQKMTVKVSEGKNKGKMVSIPKSIGHLTLDSKNYKEVKNWKVGEEYIIEVKVRQKAMREADRWEIENGDAGAGDVRAEFDIIAASTDTKEDKEED